MEGLYHQSTVSFCPSCRQLIPARFIVSEGKVFLSRRCLKHGEEIVLFEEDAAYWLQRNSFDKPGTITKTQTGIKKGCPFDCGLCPDHGQHTCIGLIEVTSKCSLGCPACFAKSGKGEHLPLDKIGNMMDFFIESEGGEAEILQVSGGEPSEHPDIIPLLRSAREKRIKYVMLNTNGLRIARDQAFVDELSSFKGRFEIYLQFDGLTQKAHTAFRGKDLREEKKQAIWRLGEAGIPVTLVATIAKGINEQEIGDIIRFGMAAKGVRGVSFQPLALFGRLPGNIQQDRVTLSGIVRRIIEQVPETFAKGDIIPLPCNVDRVAVSYLVRSPDGELRPITRSVRVQDYLPFIDNTFVFDASAIAGSCRCMGFLKDILPKGLTRKALDKKIGFVSDDTFRVTINSFVDAHNFDLRSMQKECVHLITPGLRRIPLSAYNMVHRK